MKDKKKKNRLWSGEFKLKVVLDIIENELLRQDMYCSLNIHSGFNIDWQRTFLSNKDYGRTNQFHNPEVEQNLELKLNT